PRLARAAPQRHGRGGPRLERQGDRLEEPQRRGRPAADDCVCRRRVDGCGDRSRPGRAADHTVSVQTWDPGATTEALPEAGSDDFVDLFTSQYAKLVGVLRISGAERTAADAL